MLVLSFFNLYAVFNLPINEETIRAHMKHVELPYDLKRKEAIRKRSPFLPKRWFMNLLIKEYGISKLEPILKSPILSFYYAQWFIVKKNKKEKKKWFKSVFEALTPLFRDVERIKNDFHKNKKEKFKNLLEKIIIAIRKYTVIKVEQEFEAGCACITKKGNKR